MKVSVTGLSTTTLYFILLYPYYIRNEEHLFLVIYSWSKFF